MRRVGCLHGAGGPVAPTKVLCVRMAGVCFCMRIAGDCSGASRRAARKVLAGTIRMRLVSARHGACRRTLSSCASIALTAAHVGPRRATSSRPCRYAPRWLLAWRRWPSGANQGILRAHGGTLFSYAHRWTLRRRMAEVCFRMPIAGHCAGAWRNWAQAAHLINLHLINLARNQPGPNA